MLTLSYYGAEKVVANYNVMGVAKAALEACVRYLAADLGPSGVRVNAISAGPVRTLSASGVRDFRKLYGTFQTLAPLRSNITIEDVGKTALWLASDLSSAVTGEVVYVDGGFNVMGVPAPRRLEAHQAADATAPRRRPPGRGRRPWPSRGRRRRAPASTEPSTSHGSSVEQPAETVVVSWSPVPVSTVSFAKAVADLLGDLRWRRRGSRSRG